VAHTNDGDAPVRSVGDRATLVTVADRRQRWQSAAERAADLAWPTRPRTWRDLPPRLRGTLTEVLRLTTAAVLAWLLAWQVTGQKYDLTGALTALLVLQASAYSTVRMGLVRVGAVLTGVLVAVGFSTLAGLTWWSLGAVIAASLLLAKVFRLGAQALEVPISAMLILGVTAPDLVAEARVAHTLVGAGVGVLFNFVLPAAVPNRRAGNEVLRVAYAAAECLDGASRTLAAGQVTRRDLSEWAERARAVSGPLAVASRAVSQVEESRKLNPRALGTRSVEPVLRSGLDRLEGCVIAIRALFVVLMQELPDEPPGAEQRPDRPGSPAYDEDARQAFAVVLDDIADCLRGFGQLVRAEAEGNLEEAERAMASSLEILRETRAILTELLMSRPSNDAGLWLLRGSILAAVEQVLVELDLERRFRQREEWQRRSALVLPRLAGLEVRRPRTRRVR
jgi:hypothetical protein